MALQVVVREVEVPVNKVAVSEVVKEVVKEVPIQVPVVREVPVEVAVVKEITRDVMRDVPVERVVTVDKVHVPPLEKWGMGYDQEKCIHPFIYFSL